MKTYDFEISADGPYFARVQQLGSKRFVDLAQYLLHLPYKRPFGKTPIAVLAEACETCSSKHGVLKAIADEHGRDEIELVLCFFLMNERNTPGITGALSRVLVGGIPEAHCYLRVNGQRIDATKPSIRYANIADDVPEERPISLQEQSRKTKLHRDYQTDWLKASDSPIPLITRGACEARVSTRWREVRVYGLLTRAAHTNTVGELRR